jgi:hypothetical protein
VTQNDVSTTTVRNRGRTTRSQKPKISYIRIVMLKRIPPYLVRILEEPVFLKHLFNIFLNYSCLNISL